MKIRVKTLVKLGFLAVLTILGIEGCLLFIGPRMKVQPSIQSFQAVMPALPESATPLQPASWKISATKAAELVNPLRPTAENLAAGKTYYGYYCAFCHGDGSGVGPVGESYNPRPAALRSSKVAAMTDGELYLAMLTGRGHQPVLEYVVQENFRWYVVLYVRQLAHEKPASP